ncbi:peptidyl-prolyl cis-trans isomerase [Dokdonia sp. LLG6352-1]|uniref:peptidyl-prolyl cis-trans isomerase n=1 Tax=Dokdonia sp. LLG6352-1 TaxID=3160831 RepID=UPI003869974F
MSNYKSFFILGSLTFLLAGCGYFQKTEEETVIARVNDHTLTEETLKDILSSNTITDSASFVQNYINNWATDQLLLDGAMRNLPKDDQEAFEALVSNYRKDLYIRYYKDALINKQLDSIVSDNEAKAFYENNKQNFLLNEPLLQFKFIQVEEDYSDLSELKKLFRSSDYRDAKTLDSLRFQYKNHFLNDSIWVKERVVINQINIINNENSKQLLKKTNFIQLRDSLGLYLIAVKNTLGRNDIAPLEYVRPTINQIINNKRKLALIKRLEKEIKDDAIKNKKFEIYN